MSFYVTSSFFSGRSQQHPVNEAQASLGAFVHGLYVYNERTYQYTTPKICGQGEKAKKPGPLSCNYARRLWRVNFIFWYRFIMPFLSLVGEHSKARNGIKMVMIFSLPPLRVRVFQGWENECHDWKALHHLWSIHSSRIDRATFLVTFGFDFWMEHLFKSLSPWQASLFYDRIWIFSHPRWSHLNASEFPLNPIQMPSPFKGERAGVNYFKSPILDRHNPPWKKIK